MDKRKGWRNNNEFCLKVGFGHQPMGMKALLLSKRMIIETSLFGCSLCINHAAQHTAIYWPNVLNGSRVVIQIESTEVFTSFSYFPLSIHGGGGGGENSLLFFHNHLICNLMLET